MSDPGSEEDRPSPEVLLALRLIPGVGPSLAQYFLDRSEKRERRAREFIDDSATRAGMDPEELIERILNDERLSEMFERAVGAALESSSARKRKAFAQLLADGVLAHDDAEVDLTEMLLNAVANLEVAELRLLQVMRHPPQDIAGPINIGTPMNISLLHQLYRGSPHAVEMLVAKLEASGLIKDISSGKVGEQAWIVSSFGLTVYSFIEEGSESEKPGG